MLASFYDWFVRHNGFICGFLVALNLYSAFIAFAIRGDMFSTSLDILLATWFICLYNPKPD